MNKLLIIFFSLLFSQKNQAQTFEILFNDKDFQKTTSVVEIKNGFVIAILEGALTNNTYNYKIQKISLKGEKLDFYLIKKNLDNTWPVNLTKISDSVINVSLCYTTNDSVKFNSLNLDKDLKPIAHTELNLDKKLTFPYAFTLNSRLLTTGEIFSSIGLFSFENPDESGFYLVKFGPTLENIQFIFYPRNAQGYSLIETILPFQESDTILIFAKRVFLTNTTLNITDSLPDNFYRFPHNAGEAAVFKPFKAHWFKNKLVIGGGRTYDIYRYNNLSQDTFKIFTNDALQLTSHYSPSSFFGDYIYLAGTNRFNLGNIYIDSYESYLRIFKVDSALNLRWQRDYNRYDGFYYFPLYTLATSDGGCLIAATRNNYNTMGEKADLYLLKVDSLGNYTPMVGLENPTTTTQTLVYPNPGKTTLTIETTEGTTGKKFRMYNSTGTLMFQQRLQTETETIDVSSLPAGIYIYETQNHNGMVERGKWVKMD